uniref:Uncharacterized protein n=1 Tax=Arundo donax TaxID=35708 RepID=A0A0A9E3U9_ARUDO
MHGQIGNRTIENKQRYIAFIISKEFMIITFWVFYRNFPGTTDKFINLFLHHGLLDMEL